MRVPKIISLGGSIIAPAGGFSPAFLKKFIALIVARVKAGDRFLLMTGGGATARVYQTAARGVGGLSDTDIDWVGTHATRLNAEFMRVLLGKYAHAEVVTNPTKKVKTARPIIVCAGWKPGWSTDFDAVKLAETYGAREVVNLSNVDYVYTADPKKNKSAKKLEWVSWKDYRKIAGDKWRPGANLPFDPIASRLAQKLGVKVLFTRGTDLGEVKKVLTGKKFKGTTIQ